VKNILFLMTDQHRLDCVSYQPGAIVETPNLARIAGSVGFTNCLTVNPICTPARTALLTGKYTHQIGTLAMSGDLNRQHPTYLRALQGAGYWTAGVGKFHWLQGWPWGSGRGMGHDLAGMHGQTAEFGLDHVWEAAGKQLALRNYCDYARHLDTKGLLEPYRDWIDSCSHNAHYPKPGEITGEPWPFPEEDYVDIVTAEHIIGAIRDRPADRPFCVFGSFCSPHPPYDPPQSYLDLFPEETEDFWIPGDQEWPDDIKAHLRRARRAYRAMVRLVDDQVGRIMQTLEDEGLLNDTVVMFTADHGEQLGDRGCGGKQDPWSGSAMVPCAIRHPDYLSGTLNNTPVEIIDLTATMLEVAGLDPATALAKPWPAFHDRVPCRSLMPIVRGETDRVRDFAFSECSNRWQLIQTERWLYVRRLDTGDPDTPCEALYDRTADPNCFTDLAGDAASAEPLAWCRRRRDFVLDHTPPAQLRWAPLLDPEAPPVL